MGDGGNENESLDSKRLQANDCHGFRGKEVIYDEPKGKASIGEHRPSL